MSSPQLLRVLEHLRSMAAAGSAPGDVTATRARMAEYNAVDPATKLVEATVVPVDVAGVRCEWLLAEGSDPARRLLYIHGGGWMSGDLDSHRALSARIARAAGVAVLAVHYRLIPEHPFPAGLDDCVHTFRWLQEHGPGGLAPAAATFVAGDSAGGNLALSLVLACRERGITAPDAVVGLSPATDFSASGESYRTRAVVDPILPADPAVIHALGHVYTQGRADPNDPLCSPLNGDLRGLPPTLLQVGDAEVLLDDSVRFAARARQAGSDVTLDIWPEMPHVWQLFAGYLPEADQAIERIGAFLRGH